MLPGPTIRALASSFLLVLAFPRPDLGIVSLFALVPLLSVIEGAPRIRAFFTGWLTAFVWYFVSLNWISNSLLLSGNFPFPLNQLAIVLLCSILALYTGLFAFIVAAIGPLGRWSLVVYPAAWVTVEFLRSWALAPFPWLLLGSAFWKYPSVLPLFALTGVYGVSFAVVVVNTSIHRVAVSLGSGDRRQAAIWASITSGVVAALLLVASITGNGDDDQQIKVGVVQGNYEQKVKWEESYRDDVISTYISLTRKAVSEGASIVVWPETAMPLYFQVEPALADRLRELAREEEVHLVFGSDAFDIIGRKLIHYNRAYHLSPTGQEEHYDKVRLVPFGEYVPFKGLLPFVEKVVPGAGEFAAGRWTAPFDTPVRSGVLICYEVSFPGLSRREVADGAGIILNITNDAWFGRSWGPYQHLAMASLRAAENGVPVVRAANTGISAIVDRKGRQIKRLGLFEKGYIVAEVRTRTEPTFYTRWGNLIVYLSVIVILFVVFQKLAKRFKPKYG